MSLRGKSYTYVIEDDMANISAESIKEAWKTIEEEMEDKWYCIFAKDENVPNPFYKFKKIKGEKKLLKIIVKNKETGIQKCVNIPKERENDDDIKCLKVGMVVLHRKDISIIPEIVEVVKIVGDRPKGAVFSEYDSSVYPLTWNPCSYARRAGRVTYTKEYLDACRQIREEIKTRDGYQKKPYFNVRLDPIKGSSDHQENLEKIKFPCWCVFRYPSFGKDKIGMLVTGMPQWTLEYQLIDMTEQVSVNDVCTMFRDTDLKALMDKRNIEIIKGESQLWKIGKFNI